MVQYKIVDTEFGKKHIAMIKEIAQPKLKNPVCIAAWPGMGEVAYRSALYLKEVLGFKPFAKLEAGTFFRPAAVFVDKGVVNLPDMPAGFFYYLKGKHVPDMILFLGEAQPPLEYAEDLSIAIVNFLRKYKTKFIFTFAAKPEPIDHKAEAGVWMVSTHNEIFKEFSKFGVKILNEGQISGLNGIILGVGKKKGIKGACLLGEIPFYTVQIENPKATFNILRIMNDYFELRLNMAPLQERVHYIEEEIDKLIDYLKNEGQQPGPHPARPQGPLPLSDEDIDKIKKDLAGYTKLPQSAREHIDLLFKDAQHDVGKASTLKNELDRWNVYKEYEDRFLDLFKKRDKKEEIH